MYIHELKEWPRFTWDEQILDPLVRRADAARLRLFEQLKNSRFDSGISNALREEASLKMLTQEVLKTSEIEGAKLDPDQVRSSIALKLNLELGGIRATTQHRDVEGIVDVVLDASHRWREPLTSERLFLWHSKLFQTGWGDAGKISVGQWRQGSIQVVSSPYNKQRIHFEGPAALRLPAEMDRFLDWFEGASDINPTIKAGIAHFYFVTTHPFEDGNGRIARAITDLAMARVDRVDQRFYSMSAQIKSDRKGYYDILESSQRATLAITPWLEWFLNCLERSIWAEDGLAQVIKKSQVLQRLENVSLNHRQQKIIVKYLDGSFGEFLNSTKYKHSAGCSADTANRDLIELVKLGILERVGKGKSTNYTVPDFPD